MGINKILIGTVSLILLVLYMISGAQLFYLMTISYFSDWVFFLGYTITAFVIGFTIYNNIKILSNLGKIKRANIIGNIIVNSLQCIYFYFDGFTYRFNSIIQALVYIKGVKHSDYIGIGTEWEFFS